jgi:hypothetical protein
MMLAQDSSYFLLNLGTMLRDKVCDARPMQAEGIGIFWPKEHQIECHIAVEIEDFTEKVIEGQGARTGDNGRE